MTNPIQDAVAGLQQPGLDVEFIGPGGRGAKIEDPASIVAGLCETAKEVDGSTDPWPTESGDLCEYVRSEVAEKIGAGLITGIIRLAHLRIFRIHYVFRRKDKWVKAGKQVLGQMKRPSGLLREYSSADFIVLLNWTAWNAMNPMQRVALVYHELRHGDGEGKVQGHDFEGFFDELQLFGTKTYRDWNELAAAVDDGERVRHQFSLDLDAA